MACCAQEQLRSFDAAPANRSLAADLMSRRAYLDLAPEIIERALTGHLLVSARGEIRTTDRFVVFDPAPHHPALLALAHGPPCAAESLAQHMPPPQKPDQHHSVSVASISASAFGPSE